MSGSYRTLPKNILAIDRMPRDKKGAIIFPRIIVRKPKQGDVHPLDRRSIAIGFNAIPAEYFYGLREIELRPRTGSMQKQAFGRYYLDKGYICTLFHQGYGNMMRSQNRMDD